MLEQIIDEQVAAADRGDRRAFFESDNRFHRALFQIADRDEIWHWLAGNNAHLERYRWLRVLVANLPWEEIVRQHAQLYQALETRSIDETDYLVTTHLHLMLVEQQRVINAFPDYFAPRER